MKKDVFKKAKRRLNRECDVFGHPLLVGDGTSQLYWKGVRKALGIKWWQFRIDETLLLNKNYD